VGRITPLPTFVELTRPTDERPTDGVATLDTDFMEEFPNQAPFPDGEIYFMIERYRYQPDKGLEEDKWWSYLKDNKPKYLRLFLKHKTLPTNLNRFKRFRILWTGVICGNFHKILAAHCDEVYHR
jgi:Protein of unknown function (DUF3723)